MYCGNLNEGCNSQDWPPSGNYTTLKEAIHACDIDSTCKGILSHKCNEKYFQKCTGFNLCPSQDGSCSYAKPERSNINIKQLKFKFKMCLNQMNEFI